MLSERVAAPTPHLTSSVERARVQLSGRSVDHVAQLRHEHGDRGRLAPPVAELTESTPAPTAQRARVEDRARVATSRDDRACCSRERHTARRCDLRLSFDATLSIGVASPTPDLTARTKRARVTLADGHSLRRWRRRRVGVDFVRRRVVARVSPVGDTGIRGCLWCAGQRERDEHERNGAHRSSWS